MGYAGRIPATLAYTLCFAWTRQGRPTWVDRPWLGGSYGAAVPYTSSSDMSMNGRPESGAGHSVAGSPGICGDSMVNRTKDTFAVPPDSGTLLSRCRSAAV